MVNNSNVQTKKLDITKNGLLYGPDITLSKKMCCFMVNKSNVQTKKLDIAKNGLLYGQVTRNVQIWSELWSDITLSTKFTRFGQRYVPFVTTQWEHGLKGGHKTLMSR